MEWTQPFPTAILLLVVNILQISRLILVDSIQCLKKWIVGSPSLQEYYKGKTVLVTGASSGIGEKLVEVLADCGSNVILSSRNAENLEAIAKRIRMTSPKCRLMVVPVDMEDYINMGAFFEKCSSCLLENGINNYVDVVILNAGLSSRGPVEDTSLSTVQKLMATNFFGPVAVAKAFLPQMLLHGHGAIAVVSSVQGKLGIPLRASYSASKHAVQGFFESLRAEVASRNVKVTIVSPGYVNTALSLNACNGDGSKYGKMDETTAKGLSPLVVAKSILLGILGGTPDVVIADAKSVAAIQGNVMMPGLMAKVLKKK